MKKIELKKCPFCGGKADFGFKGVFTSIVDNNWVECTLCHAETQIYDTREEAANVWNMRGGKISV